MSESALYLLIGLLASIPVTVLLNLATPRIERWWGGRSVRKAEELEARDRKLRERARSFQEDRHAFDLYLWRALFVLLRGLLLGFTSVGLSLLVAAAIPVSFAVAIPVALFVLLTYRLVSGVATEAVELIRLVGGAPIPDHREETERHLR